MPSLVLKARHLSGSAICNFYRLGVPEQALGGIPLDSGIVMEDKPSKLSYIQQLALILHNSAMMEENDNE